MKKSQTKKLPLTSDIVFKRVFSREGSEEILKALLEAIIEIPIQKVRVKNPELPRNLYDSKAGILDVKVEIDENILCNIEMHFIEIPKFIKKNPKADTKLEQWLWLLAGREEKLEMAKKENQEIEKAIDIIDEMSMDEKEWELYESRRLAIMDYNSGMIHAEEKGERKKQREIARELLKMGMDIKDIEKATGLTKDEIEKL